VVAPLASVTGELWAELAAFRLIVYPYIEGVSAMERGLTDEQWVEYGAILRRIHAVTPSAELTQQMRHETFVPHWQWSRIAATLHTQIKEREYPDPHEHELATFWRGRHAEVGRIMARAEALGRQLRQRGPRCVLCHADIHTANVLVDHDGGLHFVDWDETIIAPKERDLMFVVGSRIATVVKPHEEELFFRGYGERAVDALALAYYRYEWVVQEIGAYGEQVFLAPEVGEKTKADAVRRWIAQFDPGETVDMAYGMDSAAW
jgi:spectinomycin phosphotransferase